MSKYAQVKNNQIVNIIVLEDDTLFETFKANFDYMIDVSEQGVKKGDIFDPDTQTFSTPMPSPSSEETVQVKMTREQKEEFEAFQAWKASQG